MGYSTRGSLRHEYEQFVEREIEEYKDRVPRSAILKIADEAVERLHAQEQATLNELVLWLEVDRIIAARLRIPVYQTWARRRRKQLELLRRPDAWGFSETAALVRMVPTAEHAHIVVAQPRNERAALFLAANGCTVTAVEPHADIVARVLKVAEENGLSARVHMLQAGLNAYAPTTRLTAFVCSTAAFAGLSARERARVLGALQNATSDGGVHLVEAMPSAMRAPDLDELFRTYDGWDVSVEPGAGTEERTFVARKS